jgi:hypothetical protein
MTREEAVTKFSELSRERQIAVLATFGFEITIDGRATYVPGTNDVANPPQLRRVNETLHRVTSHIRDLANGSRERYPDKVIISIMWEAAAEHLQEALAKS